MESNQEVDKILDTSCTIEEDRYNELCDNIKVCYDRMIIEKHNMNALQSQLYRVGVEVALRLADFTEVLNHIQEESLAEEITLETRESEFSRKQLESYRKSLVVRDSEDGEEDYYQVGTIDSYDGCFYSMIRFPKSFLYRADWIYKLVVEKEAYEIRRKGKFPWQP